MSFIRLLARILPTKVRAGLHDLIGCSSIKSNPDSFIGAVITLGIVIAFALTVGTSSYDLPFPLSMPLVTFGAVFVIVVFLFYVWLSLNVSSKAHQVEEALPDALQLMSSNIRAGLTIDKALLLAARPEFGALEEEIRRVGKETMAGRNLTDALSRMTNHIRSDDLTRTIELVINSIRSGGQLADILDQTAEDLRDQQIIRKEISASVLMYVLFIFIAISIGAPALFAMSSFLVDLLSKNMSMIAKEMPKDFDGMGAMPMKMTGVKISTDFIRTYSILSICISCFFGSMIMGLILKGEEKEGFKYTVPMTVLALALFVIGSLVLKYTIGGMMPQ
jgi:flagellar protein FlaJ